MKHDYRRSTGFMLGFLAAGVVIGHGILSARASDAHGGPAEKPTPAVRKPAAAGFRVRSAPRAEATTPDEIWTRLMEGNRRFVADKPQARPLLQERELLAQGQHPKVIIVGCSDSRVSPELVFDQSLGDLFVIRLAGNVADPLALGSIEYAVEHLHARLIVILGHEKCGAVAAACSGDRMPTRNLDAIVKRIAPALETIKTRAAGDDLVQLGVEANIRQSARDILEESPIVRQELASGRVMMVNALYRLKSGEVSRL